MLRPLTLTAFLVIGATGAHAADFKLEEYFRGTTYAEGRFSAINGVSRAFKVKLTGRVSGRTLTLVEDFTYADGERDRKTWRFTKTGAGRYDATREDVVGTAKVSVRGDTARYSYSVYLDAKNRKNLVRFHDTMRLKPDGTVHNTAWVTKFGLLVARTTVDFRR